MRRLSALDAWLLDLETPTVGGHVGVLVGVDPAEDDRWGADRVRAVLESRQTALASLSRRLASAPLVVGGRYLVTDPHFDLEFHVRELVLPSPGTTQQLAEQVAALHARPLDRSRPLWELHVVTGRDDGRAAVYAKYHRTLVDESSGTELTQALLDVEPEPTALDSPSTPAESRSSAADLAREELRSLAGDPRELGYAVPDALQRLGRFAGTTGLPGARLLSGAADVAGRLLGPAPTAASGPGVPTPRTRLDAALTPHRRLAFAAVPMEEVGRACDHHRLRVEELVLTMSAAAVRRWLLDHDALPLGPLVAAVPVPVRAEDGQVRVAPVLVQLPTQLPGVVEQAAAVRDGMAAATEGLELPPDHVLDEVVSTQPTALAGLAARAMSGMALAPGSSANLTVAHAHGPAAPLYLAGASVDEIVPLAALGPATGGLAVTSYAHRDRLHLGLTACREIVPDLGRVLGYLTDALAELQRG